MARKRRRRSPASLPGLIGWLSLCMLTAAMGRSLDARWQTIWAEVGVFGLVAAVGLGSVERNRQARLQQAQDRALRARLECGLARLDAHSDTIESIDSAVRRIAKQATVDMRDKLGQAQRNRRREQLEMVADFPLAIVPVDQYDGELPSISGALQQFSSRVVAFEHYEPIPTQTVLLTFRLEQQVLSFVVDVTWTRKVDGVFFSGGTVLAVGTPRSDNEREAAAVPALATSC